MNKKFISLMMTLALTVSVTTVAFAEKSTSTCDNKSCLVHATKKSNEIIKAQNVLLNRVNEKRVYEDVVKLSSDIGPRVSTTDEEHQGALYIKSQFDKLGYKAEIQEFDVMGRSVSKVTYNGQTLTSNAFSGAGATKINAEIVDCGLGYASDFEGKDLSGKIALIERGTITFVEKVSNATKAGAAAVVMYNNTDAGVTPGQQYSKDVSAVGITRADGLVLKEALKEGSVVLSVEVGEPPVNKSWNVVATMKPSTNGNKKDKNDSQDIVCVTAHMDSVPLAPGANDNASGSAAMIEIARSMKGLDIDKELRFIACGSEEVGLLGSEAYVDSLSDNEKHRIIANFNMDMVATGYDPCNELAVYTNNGSENTVTEAMKNAGKKLSCLTTDSVSYDGTYDGEMGSSDHVSFENAGIASALFINVDSKLKDNPRSAIEPYYHKPEDNITNFSSERLVRTVKLVGIALYDTLNAK